MKSTVAGSDDDSGILSVCTDLWKCRPQAFRLQARQRPAAGEDFAEGIFGLFILIEAAEDGLRR